MRQRTIIMAAVMALTVLTVLAYATESRGKRAQDKLQVTASSTTGRVLLSRGERESIVKDAITAVHKSVQIDLRKRNGDNIPRRFWGEAVQKLRPLRVINDRMNVIIVLTEDPQNERGIYVCNPISSYAVFTPNTRFAAFELLSKPGDKAFGNLSRYHIRKQSSPTSLSQGGGRTAKLR